MAGTRPNYATIQDIGNLWRALSATETTKALALLPVVSDRLRFEAKKVGKDLDLMITKEPVLETVAKNVTVDIIARVLMTPTEAPSGGPMSQYSESGMGYSVSGTFLNPGGGLFIKNSELEALGLRRQQYGTIDLCDGGSDEGNNS